MLWNPDFPELSKGSRLAALQHSEIACIRNVVSTVVVEQLLIILLDNGFLAFIELRNFTH
jgi:hypothetical protein